MVNSAGSLRAGALRTRTMVGTVPPGSGRMMDEVIDDLLVHGPPPDRPSPQQSPRRGREWTRASDVADIEVLLRDAIADARAMLRANMAIPC